MEGTMVKLLLALALTACGYSASFSDCRVTCTDSSGCPDNFTCQAGICRGGSTASLACSELPDAGEPGTDAALHDAMPDATFVTPTAIGTWVMTYHYAQDSCGNPATQQLKNIIIAMPSTYTLMVGGATTQSGYTVGCTSTLCTIDFTITWTLSSVPYSEPTHATLDGYNTITGTSTRTKTGSPDCIANATITGFKS
jgi:hypothetical protein